MNRPGIHYKHKDEYFTVVRSMRMRASSKDTNCCHPTCPSICKFTKNIYPFMLVRFWYIFKKFKLFLFLSCKYYASIPTCPSFLSVLKAPGEWWNSIVVHIMGVEDPRGTSQLQPNACWVFRLPTGYEVTYTGKAGCKSREVLFTVRASKSTMNSKVKVRQI